MTEGLVVSPEGAPKFSSESIHEKKLTFEEASKCLNTLGKDESGCRYAYLMITAANRQLTDVSIILNFRHVLFLDLSQNYLNAESLQVLADMPFLILLKAECNRIESAKLKPMSYLQVLCLNQNQIKDVEGIDLPLLDTLEMNHNDIYTTLFETCNLEDLKQLEMRSNLLFEIEGVFPSKIEKLYLAANKISSLNLDELKNLQILHLRENMLLKLDGFSEKQSNLKYLNLRNNQISKFSEFTKLKCLPNLETLIVTGNPLPGTEALLGGEDMAGEGGKTRDPVVVPLLVVLPNLKRINKYVVTMEDKIEAEDMQNEILESLYLDNVSLQETDDNESTNRE